MMVNSLIKSLIKLSKIPRIKLFRRGICKNRVRLSRNTMTGLVNKMDRTISKTDAEYKRLRNMIWSSKKRMIKTRTMINGVKRINISLAKAKIIIERLIKESKI